MKDLWSFELPKEFQRNISTTVTSFIIVRCCPYGLYHNVYTFDDVYLP